MKPAEFQAQIEAAMRSIAAELGHIGALAQSLETDGCRAGLELRLRVRPDSSMAWAILPLGDVGAPVRTTWTELPPLGVGGADDGVAH